MSKNIIIVEHDPKWVGLFQKERDLLKIRFNNELRSINHIGSTAIAGLAAKPIIDISMGVAILAEFEDRQDELNDIGYTHCNGSVLEGWILYDKKQQHNEFHLHIMAFDSKRLIEQLIFQQCLLIDAELRDAYENTKKYYLKYDDHLFYSMNKIPFVNKAVQSFTDGYLESSKLTKQQFYQRMLDDYASS